MKWANLDGMLHVANSDVYCSCINRRHGTFQTCRRCKGVQHWQPIYGGYIELCETCLEDADRWSTGPLPEHDGGIIR